VHEEWKWGSQVWKSEKAEEHAKGVSGCVGSVNRHVRLDRHRRLGVHSHQRSVQDVAMTACAQRSLVDR